MIEFISRDKGWILVEEPPFLPDRHIKLLVTADGGKTWSAHQFPNGFQLQEIRDKMPVRFTDDQHGWVLSTEGLLRTQDGGKNWKWE